MADNFERLKGGIHCQLRARARARAAGAWPRSTSPRTSSTTARSRSRCCGPSSPPPSAASGSSARSRSPPGCSTRTSCRCSTPARPTASSTTSCRSSRASRCASGSPRGELPVARRGADPRARSPTRWPTPTRTASCTATSSRTTCMLSGRHALVTDFGVAKAVSEADRATDSSPRRASRSARRPTWRRSRRSPIPHLDHRADIYAVGVLGYEMLTGQPPFRGATPQEVLAAHMTRQPEPITTHRPTVPPALAGIIMDAWRSGRPIAGRAPKRCCAAGGPRDAAQDTDARRSDHAGSDDAAEPGRPPEARVALWLGWPVPGPVVGRRRRLVAPAERSRQP